MSLGRKTEGGGGGGGVGFVPLHLGALLKYRGSDASRARAETCAQPLSIADRFRRSNKVGEPPFVITEKPGEAPL